MLTQIYSKEPSLLDSIQELTKVKSKKVPVVINKSDDERKHSNDSATTPLNPIVKKSIALSCQNHGRLAKNVPFANMRKNSSDSSSFEMQNGEAIFDEKVSSVFSHDQMDNVQQKNNQLLNTVDNYQTQLKISSFNDKESNINHHLESFNHCL